MSKNGFCFACVESIEFEVIILANVFLQANNANNAMNSMQQELVTPLAQIPLTQISLNNEVRLPPKPPQQRHFSPLTLETTSSRSDSPMSAASQCDSARNGGPSQSPVSFISSSAPSEATQDSGLGGMSSKVRHFFIFTKFYWI